MGEKKNKNLSNIFYGVIGILVLMVAVVGATFAYFTATASNNVLTGNMATIQFDVTVQKVSNADNIIGMIPMSNNMMEKALKSSKGICVDDNNNAVCQIYKITVINQSSAALLVDGYVTLTGGSGTPKDWNTVTDAEKDLTREWLYSAAGAETTMRWAQAFCSSEDATSGMVTSCTTAGASTSRTDSTVTIDGIGGTNVAANGFNRTEILTTTAQMTTTAKINGNNNTVINKNYIRISDHLATDTTYSRTEDVTSALVFSQFLKADDKIAGNNTGTSSTAMEDAQVYYIVIWLSENGNNQTAGATGAASAANAFYQGKVKFVSAQGSEVTAAFADHVRVTPNTSAGI